MTGLPKYNFDEFLRVGAMLEKFGWDVRNPAKRELEMGFDPETTATPEQLKEAVVWDLQQVLEVDEVLVLPGWKNSRGAITEVALAQWLGKDVHEVSLRDGGIKISEPLDRIQLK